MKRAALVCFLIAATTAPGRAAAPALWGALTPGAYAVGFKTAYVYDYSRAWELKTGDYGEVLARRPRPIRFGERPVTACKLPRVAYYQCMF